MAICRGTFLIRQRPPLGLLQARGTGPGQGDGNGIVQGTINWSSGANGCVQNGGETVMFWADLSKIGLIEGSYTTAASSPYYGGVIPGTAIANYLPEAKLGGGNYLYVWNMDQGAQTNTALNYYGLSPIADLNGAGYIESPNGPGLTVQQAYAIDKKMDDGYPQTGNVTAQYLNQSVVNWTCSFWAAGGPAQGGGAGSPTATTCMDNSGGTQHYSLNWAGNGLNCALSFQVPVAFTPPRSHSR